MIVVNKVGTDDNLSDAFTKGLDAASVQRHPKGVGIQVRSDRHRMAPELDIIAQGADDKCEDE